MTDPRRFAVRGALAAALLLVGTAAIERLDLRQMVGRADGAYAGRIVSSWTTWNEAEGSAARIFTHLRIVGENLYTGQPADVTVSFFGGDFGTERQWHADMPTAADTKVGNRVVAFAKWHPTMGGVGMLGIYAAYGGLFRLENGPRGEVVIGRGEGFAVEKNVTLEGLRADIGRLRAAGQGR
jgi:hypothetical protein